jgi:hypothetical protein
MVVVDFSKLGLFVEFGNRRQFAAPSVGKEKSDVVEVHTDGGCKTAKPSTLFMG